MTTRLTAVLVAGILCGAVPAVHTQSQAERVAARDLIARLGDVVVAVHGTATVRISQGGREVQNRDERIQTVATVLDSSGLAVMSLTALDPGDLIESTLARGRGAGAAGVSVTTEPTNVRYRFSSGREVPVRVVLRDNDLDLAFLRPLDDPDGPFTAVGDPADGPAVIDLVTVLQRMPEIAAWQPTTMFATVQAVVDTPRLFYLINPTGQLGAAVFDSDGGFVGVVLRLRSVQGSPIVVVPASDILDVSRQANQP